MTNTLLNWQNKEYKEYCKEEILYLSTKGIKNKTIKFNKKAMEPYL